MPGLGGLNLVKALQNVDPQQIGKYRLLGRLGSGGMGRVYLGRSPGGRLVAVKLIRSEFAESSEFRTRFKREVAAARQVSGIFTAPVVDADPDAPEPWLVTAYVDGPSLADALESKGPLPTTSVLTLAAGLAEGLGAIHSAGTVHRDLKPSNVLLARDGPRIIDFGISRATDATGLTTPGLVIGSPGFMSPEQAEGREVGPPSDIFALGAVLTFAATGEGPFGAGTTPALLYRIVHSPPSTDRLPKQIRSLVEQCLAKDPQQRPTTDQILAELGAPQLSPGWLPWPEAQSSSQDFPVSSDITSVADASTLTGLLLTDADEVSAPHDSSAQADPTLTSAIPDDVLSTHEPPSSATPPSQVHSQVSGPARTARIKKLMRLLDEAVKIAQTKKMEDQLADVAQVLARIDSDRAETIARSLYGFNRAVALAYIAGEVVDADPHQAARLLDDAQRYLLEGVNRGGRVMPDYIERTLNQVTLTNVAQAVKASDPSTAGRLIDGAELVVRKTQAQYERKGDDWWNLQLIGIAEAASGIDPSRAEKISRSITQKHIRPMAIAKVASAMARTDPDRAEHLARSLNNPYRPFSTGARAWAAWALVDIARAPRTRSTDSHHAVQLLKEAEQIARRAKDVDALVKVAQAWARGRIDSSRAAQLLDEAEQIARRTEQGQQLVQVAEAVSSHHPTQAELIARSVASEAFRNEALASVATVVGRTDPARAEQIARSLTSDDWRIHVANAIAAGSPSEAELVARSITSPLMQAVTLARVAEATAHTDLAHSAQLVREAEQIVRQTSGRSIEIKSARLRVVQAAAIADPDRAEQLADQLEDYDRVPALISIVRACGANRARSQSLRAVTTRVSDAIVDLGISRHCRRLRIGASSRSNFGPAPRSCHFEEPTVWRRSVCQYPR